MKREAARVERQAAKTAATKEQEAAAEVAEQELADVAAVAAAAVEEQHKRLAAVDDTPGMSAGLAGMKRSANDRMAPNDDDP